MAPRVQDGAWQRASTAPFDQPLELAVITDGDVHALVFPCRRVLRGWINAETKEPIQVRPTHWRGWAPDERRHN